MWAEDDKDGREWEGGGGEKEETTEESSAQGLKKHCSNAMNATGTAGVMHPYNVNVCLHVLEANPDINVT